MERFFGLAYRAMFTIAVLLALLAVSEGFAQLFGHTLVRRIYSAGRLLEFSAMLMTFVIALLLRGIRASLSDRRP